MLNHDREVQLILHRLTGAGLLCLVGYSAVACIGEPAQTRPKPSPTPALHSAVATCAARTLQPTPTNVPGASYHGSVVNPCPLHTPPTDTAVDIQASIRTMQPALDEERFAEADIAQVSRTSGGDIEYVNRAFLHAQRASALFHHLPMLRLPGGYINIYYNGLLTLKTDIIQLISDWAYPPARQDLRQIGKDETYLHQLMNDLQRNK